MIVENTATLGGIFCRKLSNATEGARVFSAVFDGVDIGRENRVWTLWNMGRMDWTSPLLVSLTRIAAGGAREVAMPPLSRERPDAPGRSANPSAAFQPGIPQAIRSRTPSN